MGKMSEETIMSILTTLCVMTAMVLFATLVIVVGSDVRNMKVKIEETRAESCYQEYGVNSSNGTVYLRENYCGNNDE